MLFCNTNLPDYQASNHNRIYLKLVIGVTYRVLCKTLKVELGVVDTDY